MNLCNDDQDYQKIVKIILYKLYLIDEKPENYQQYWREFVSKFPNHLKQIIDSLSSHFTQELNIAIAEYIEDEQENSNFFITMWSNFFKKMDKDERNKYSDNIKNIALQVLQDNPDNSDNLNISLCSPPKTQPKLVEKNNSEKYPNIPETPKISLAQWQYLPLPDQQPDLFEEYYTKEDNLPDNFKIIGAKVRGKKHKHEGTNCDDSFEFAITNNWTIIAVADGAGSKKFSRVGAKVSCQSAIQYLTNCLENHQLKLRDEWKPETFQRNSKTGEFAEEDIEFVQKSLHGAMQRAYTSVEQAVSERQNSLAHSKILWSAEGGEPRSVNINDLSTTLLLGVHTTIKYKNNDYSFVLTCQIGDGIIGAIDPSLEIHILGIPDSGEFSGQTEFLTTKGKLTQDNLMRKTFPYFRPLKALMVMTDGVADDYFPFQSKLLELYGDLLLNRVIDFPQSEEIEIREQLNTTRLVTLEGLREATHKFCSQIQRLTYSEDKIAQVNLASVSKFAEELDVPLKEIINNKILLSAGYYNQFLWENSQASSASERLKIWLDSYHIKGSFDDRTLVVFYREI